MAKDPNEIKVNVKTIGGIVAIVIVCVGAIAAGAIAIDNSRENRVSINGLSATDAEHARQLAESKLEFATFKGAIGERTQAIKDNQTVMMSDIKKLLENMELTPDGES